MTEDWIHGAGHSPVCQILLQIVVRVVITSSPPAWTRSARMLSTPADFYFFSDCTAASTSLRRMGVCRPLCLSGDSLVLMDLHWPRNCTAQYSVLRFSIYRSSVSHFFWTILDSSSFPLFHNGQVFHMLVCTLVVVFPQIFFSLTTLFSLIEGITTFTMAKYRKLH